MTQDEARQHAEQSLAEFTALVDQWVAYYNKWDPIMPKAIKALGDLGGDYERKFMAQAHRMGDQ